ncbi:hypothetical protein PQX77_017579 [Marasmius sp. AFHP31]|nr:hypothetical protein PQX77_017579 [Marasmius sp. AFHP31]
MRPRIIRDPFQPSLTNYFKVAAAPPPPPPLPTLPQEDRIVVFYLANGEQRVFELTNLPTRTHLSDHWCMFFKYRITERPQLQVLKIEGSSYRWDYIGWREYFDIPTNEAPLFFSMSDNNTNLPPTWLQDVSEFLEAL